MVRGLAEAEVGTGCAQALVGSTVGEEPHSLRVCHRQEELWTKAKTEVDAARSHDSKPAYRDLELDSDGQTIWAACICDKVDAAPAKALVKLDTEGNHDASGSPTREQERSDNRWWITMGSSIWLPGAATLWASTIRLPGASAAGCVTPRARCRRWRFMRGSWWSGHFYYVGDDKADKCGEGRPGEPRLDPNGECQRRRGIAAYTLSGRLDPDWHPVYSGSYSLVWALHVEGTRLHTGGQFKRVSGVTQNSYARLSPASL